MVHETFILVDNAEENSKGNEIRFDKLPEFLGNLRTYISVSQTPCVSPKGDGLFGVCVISKILTNSDF